MSLDAVLAAIQAASDQRISQLKTDSDQRIQTTLETATAQAEEKRQAWIAQREKEAHAQSIRILRHAQHEADLMLNQTQNNMIDEALQAVQETLVTLRNEPNYDAVLRSLFIEAWTMLQPSLRVGETPRLEADPRDENLIKTLLADPTLISQVGSLTTHYTLNCSGGLNITSEDECIVVRNTLEARFRAALPIIRRYLAQVV